MPTFYVLAAFVVKSPTAQHAVDAVNALATAGNKVRLPDGAIAVIVGLDYAGDPIESVSIDIGDDTRKVTDWDPPTE